MKKKKILSGAFIALEAFCITAVTLFSAAGISCKVSAEGIKLLKGDYESPALTNYSVEDSKTLRLNFSEPVALSDCVITEGIECENISYDESRREVQVLLEKEMVLGKKYEFYGVVKDGNGNSLSFAFPFTGYNGRVPKLLMTEIQAKSVSSQTSKEKAAGTYRSEYIEFLCLSDGNLSGLEILSGYDGKEKKYEFPVVEVKEGEVFIVHLRKRGNGCESEEGDNLNLATASYTAPGIRDLWGDEEGTLLGNKTDVILLKNSGNSQVLDAAFYRESTVEAWSKDMEAFSLEAAQWGIYEGFEVDFASITDGITDTKTLHRTNFDYPPVCDENTWVVGSASPGSL